MKKMQTLFKQDERYKAIPELRVNINNYTMSRKLDGTSCMILNNELYKRYDANIKKRRKLPDEYIACQEEPNFNGSFPVWVKITEHDKYHHEVFNYKEKWEDGTYELCGPKVNGNKEKLEHHKLFKHGDDIIEGLSLDFYDIKEFITNNYMEGIIIKDEDTKIMYKIRRKDFGLKW